MCGKTRRLTRVTVANMAWSPGMPNRYSSNKIPIYQRFWDTLDKSGECWLWTGAINQHSHYGRLTVAQKDLWAHRVAWELTHGPVPHGLLVLHRCDVRTCCRPEHLFLGTAADNSADMVTKGRVRRDHSLWHKNPETTRGENNPRAKLTDDQVRAIRELRRTVGLTYKEIGLRFGISKQTAWQVGEARRWRHLV